MKGTPWGVIYNTDEDAPALCLTEDLVRVRAAGNTLTSRSPASSRELFVVERRPAHVTITLRNQDEMSANRYAMKRGGLSKIAFLKSKICLSLPGVGNFKLRRLPAHPDVICVEGGRFIALKDSKSDKRKVLEISSEKSRVRLMRSELEVYGAVGRESRFLRRLRHAHVIAMAAADRRRRVARVVLELPHGGALESRIGGVGEEWSARVFRQIASALSYLHGIGVIHKNLTPASVWIVSPRPVAKLADFSAATTVQERTDLGGPTAYMSPAVLSNRCQGTDSPVTCKNDVWSLGVTVHRTLTGRFPHKHHLRPTFLRDEIMGGSTRIDVSLSSPARSFVASCLTVDEVQRPSAELLLEHSWLQEP